MQTCLMGFSGRQVGLHAVAHRRGHDLRRQIVDDVSRVSIAVTKEVEHKLLAFGLVPAPQLFS
ncbi:MAG: hypothetical protein WAM11_17405 [Cyanobium sp.]